MSTGPLGKRQAKADILRGVYEDNLKTVRKPVPDRPVRRRRLRRALPIVAALVFVLVVFAGLSYQGRSVEQQAEAALQRRLALEAVSQPRNAPLEVRMTQGPVAQNTALSSPINDASAGLSIANLYGLHVKTIVIDPGHGGKDPGTSGQEGTVEKDIVLDVARRLRARLGRHDGYRILLTREADETLSLRERAAFTNEIHADLFVSLHVNWLPVDTVAAVETYYFSPRARDDQARMLARLENENSDFSMAEWQGMIHALGATMKLEESEEIAASVQQSLYRNVHEVNEHVSNWGVKTAPFMVLLAVEAPSVLVEIGCISNPAEEARLNTSEYREKLAIFLEEGIVNYLKRHSNESATTQNASEEDQGVG